MYDLVAEGNWNPQTGWNEAGPFPFWRAITPAERRRDPSFAGRQASWDFFASSSDQGILHYFFGDTRARAEACAKGRHGGGAAAPGRWRGPRCVRLHGPGALEWRPSARAAALNATALFAHFTGTWKPWLVAPSAVDAAGVPARLRAGMRRWHATFDALRLPRPRAHDGTPPADGGATYAPHAATGNSSSWLSAEELPRFTKGIPRFTKGAAAVPKTQKYLGIGPDGKTLRVVYKDVKK